MGQLPEFEAALGDIGSVSVRDEDCWKTSDSAPNACYLGITHFKWGAADIELGADMGSLAHELAHVWLNHYVGNDDSSHRWWSEIGQSKRDNAYVRLAVRP